LFTSSSLKHTRHGLKRDRKKTLRKDGAVREGMIDCVAPSGNPLIPMHDSFMYLYLFLLFRKLCCGIEASCGEPTHAGGSKVHGSAVTTKKPSVIMSGMIFREWKVRNRARRVIHAPTFRRTPSESFDS
jgi:hypothetical protein